jgi:imidazolonepropionase-like amidohydrolase
MRLSTCILALRFFILVLAFSLAVALNATAATKAVKFGNLWDGHGTIVNAVVIVENDKIQSVAASGTIPAGAEVIDLRRYTGIPGMIDSHTHMTYYWDPRSGTDPRRQPPRHTAVTVFLSQANAIKTLEAGVTTVRDLTGFGGADIAMRDLIDMGAMVGPRMFVSGPGLRNTVIRRPGVTDTPAQAAEEAKAVLDAGADWVKVYGSTGGGDDVSGDQTVSFEEMKAIIETAHSAGHKVAIHSYGPAGARDAIRAGTDTLEHATDLDDATIAELVRKKIWYVPTINHNQHYVDRSDDAYKFSEQSKQNLRNYIERNFLTAQKAQGRRADGRWLRRGLYRLWC